MSFEDERESGRRRKPDTSPNDAGKTVRNRKKKHVDPAEIGNALRSVYDRAVQEQIPPEMLDLLGKLG